MELSEDEYPAPPRVFGRGAMFVEHRLKSPQVAESAYVAPTAVLAGDVTVGPHSRVLFGAVVTAEGGPVEIGSNCVIMENAVIRGVPNQEMRLGDHVLIGPHAHLTGVDSSEHMLAAADLPGADLRLQDLGEPLPEGPFDLVFSALAIHHLAAVAKADLFARVAAVLAPGGRFVMADVIVPEDPWDVVTPLDAGFDLPETVPDLLRWLQDAGLRGHVAWQARDLAVLAAHRAV